MQLLERKFIHKEPMESEFIVKSNGHLGVGLDIIDQHFREYMV